ncbi:hypothetical protein K1719_004700 [Acacia pycnantha]|nr:hypothetical protein K1719_004700 [Acacia pycnantha]
METRGSGLEKVRQIFQQFDASHDGGLSREEMAALVVAVKPRSLYLNFNSLNGPIPLELGYSFSLSELICVKIFRVEHCLHPSGICAIDLFFLDSMEIFFLGLFQNQLCQTVLVRICDSLILNKMRKGRGGSDDELEEEDDQEVFLSTRIRLASCRRQRPSGGIGFRVGGCYGGEPFFVTRDLEELEAEEDNGYVVTYVHDENKGEVKVLGDGCKVTGA